MTAAHTAVAEALNLRANLAPALAITDGNTTGKVEAHEWPAADDAHALDGAFSNVIRSPRPATAPIPTTTQIPTDDGRA